jgi:hypothetical protein
MVQNYNKHMPIGMMWLMLRSSGWLYCTETESRDTNKTKFLSWLTDYCRSISIWYAFSSKTKRTRTSVMQVYFLNTLHIMFEMYEEIDVSVDEVKQDISKSY